MLNANDLLLFIGLVIAATIIYFVYKDMTRPKQDKPWWKYIDERKKKKDE